MMTENVIMVGPFAKERWQNGDGGGATSSLKVVVKPMWPHVQMRELSSRFEIQSNSSRDSSKSYDSAGVQ